MNENKQKIPKVIHYCWFGKNEKPKLFYRCLESWKRFCPDYEIIEWNEDNFDVNMIPYVKEAYDAKMWAFVTDVARLWVVYTYGGIYLDTDVELIKSLDSLLGLDAFFGFEDELSVATGLGFGAQEGNEVVSRMLQDYYDCHFIKSDGSYDKVTCPIRNTKAILPLFPPPEFSTGGILNIEGATIFPPEYFCPLSADGRRMNKTKNTFSIHWYSASWLDKEEMVVHEWRLFLGKCEKLFGAKIGRLVARFVYLFKPDERKILKSM